MFYCVLTGFAVLLISGKAWLCFVGMAMAYLVLLVINQYAEGSIKKRGGVESASLVDCVSYKGGGRDALYTEYTVLVRFKNGEKKRYVLNGDQAFFRVLRPYFENNLTK